MVDFNDPATEAVLVSFLAEYAHDLRLARYASVVVANVALEQPDLDLPGVIDEARWRVGPRPPIQSDTRGSADSRSSVVPPALLSTRREAAINQLSAGVPTNGAEQVGSPPMNFQFSVPSLPPMVFSLPEGAIQIRLEIPQSPPPVVNVNVPEQAPPNIEVKPNIEVNVPQQSAPSIEVNMPQQEPPVIHFNPNIDVAPAQVTIPPQPPINVNFNVPEDGVETVEFEHDTKGRIKRAKITSDE